ncbi:hypothetical protein ACFOHU_01435 [Ottowia pentelensis]|uniref:BBC1/AIM3 cysteine proteinase-fold domain-containing protein n=1 Tax=Ottowia pentelensis TaxID=511108 RepID=A0ABV6PN14_9BURK
MAYLGPTVLNWANGQIGKQVGAGECWDLADRALKNAGAKSSADYGPTGPDDDYIWGTEVQLKDSQPGDILQFRDYVMKTKTVIDVTFADDSGWDNESETEIGHPHHTAILSRNQAGGVLAVLEQNHGGHHEKVRSTSIRWTDSNPPPTTVHKSMKRQDNGKMEMATVKTTVEISITGTITAYRPQAR